MLKCLSAILGDIFVYFPKGETIKGFNMILKGELDELPEQSFYLVGNIDEAIEKAKTLKG